jgi:hypothetical protein
VWQSKHFSRRIGFISLLYSAEAKESACAETPSIGRQRNIIMPNMGAKRISIISIYSILTSIFYFIGIFNFILPITVEKHL